MLQAPEQALNGRQHAVTPRGSQASVRASTLARDPVLFAVAAATAAQVAEVILRRPDARNAATELALALTLGASVRRPGWRSATLTASALQRLLRTADRFRHRETRGCLGNGVWLTALLTLRRQTVQLARWDQP